MLKSIGIGTELFHEFIESNSYYVDKTKFIRTVFQDNTSKVVLITRPRRFGKTLTMSTFYDFLALNPEKPGDVSRQEKWFKDTKIFEDKKLCSKYMGKFPVIFISLKSVSGNDFTGAYDQLGCVVFGMYNSFSYLAKSPKLNDAEKRIFNEIASDNNFIRDISNKNKIKDSLSNLLELLNKHHDIKPILLIDEYDVPIAKEQSDYINHIIVVLFMCCFGDWNIIFVYENYRFYSVMPIKK